MSTQNKPTQGWEDDIYDCFVRHNISQIPYVPDAGHAHLIRRVHDTPQMHPIVLTTEEEGVASSCGCLLYTSDAADEEDSVDLGGRRIIKK